MRVKHLISAFYVPRYEEELKRLFRGSQSGHSTPDSGGTRSVWSRESPVAVASLEELEQILQDIRTSRHSLVAQDESASFVRPSYGSVVKSNSSIQLSNGTVLTSSGSVLPSNDSVQMSNSSVLSSNGSVQMSNGAVQMSNGSVQMSNGSFLMSNGSVPIRNGSLLMSNCSIPMSNCSLLMSNCSTHSSRSQSPALGSTETTRNFSGYAHVLASTVAKELINKAKLIDILRDREHLQRASGSAKRDALECLGAIGARNKSGGASSSGGSGKKLGKIVSANVCVFCRNNQEQEEVYASHSLKDSEGNVTCPVLYIYTCPTCGASGKRAHTIKYCPYGAGPVARALVKSTGAKL
uniref:Nanos-like protein 2 n=1 Tax=Enchytraeus coronatus TaxID=208440 RepID=A0AAU7VFF6_9ANNE